MSPSPLERLMEGVRPSLGEAVEEEAERLAERLRGEAARLAEEAWRALGEAEKRGLLHRVSPATPRGRLYGVDSGLARLRRGSRLVAVIHAVAVGVEGERHLVRTLVLPAAGPEADAAIEAAMGLAEAAMVALVQEGGVVFLDGPLADPPWVPEPGPLLGAAAEQLLGPGGSAEDLAAVHEARAGAMRGKRVIGVVKRLTGESRLSGLLSAAEARDDALAAAMAAALRGRRLGPAVVGPLRLEGGAYRPYLERLGPLGSVYVLDPRGPRGYRVEAAGLGPLEAAEAALGEAVPPAWLPEEVLAAHVLAKPPVGVVAAAARLAAAGIAGDEVAEAVYAAMGEE